ncbi:MAG TPA: sigma-70 family RNA polymerase sigma factor [Thermoanaerobaculia bacterium]|nr:sigma-70 family RNA polymerase sigma factor [Thermoanaerobaculia bacterium]
MQALTDARRGPLRAIRGGGSDHDLLDRLLAGDRGAAEALAERTYELVFASLVKLSGDRDLAADLTQETYRKAWASLGSFRRGAAFSTWLYRIAYNTFLNHVRRPALLEPLTEEREAVEPATGPDPERTIGHVEISARLRRAVLGLPEDLRLVVTARFWGEVPVAEIARLEGITGPAVRKRLKRAMAHLKDHLEADLRARPDDSDDSHHDDSHDPRNLDDDRGGVQ